MEKPYTKLLHTHFLVNLVTSDAANVYQEKYQPFFEFMSEQFHSLLAL